MEMRDKEKKTRGEKLERRERWVDSMRCGAAGTDQVLCRMGHETVDGENKTIYCVGNMAEWEALLFLGFNAKGGGRTGANECG